MRFLCFSLLLLVACATFAQKSGTIQINKEYKHLRPIVRFAGSEGGALHLRNYLIDKCLEPNKGIVQSFEIVVEKANGNYMWITSDTCCLSGENYEKIEQLGHGSHLEFMNIKGINNEGQPVIYPGMKFTLYKKL